MRAAWPLSSVLEGGLDANAVYDSPMRATAGEGVTSAASNETAQNAAMMYVRNATLAFMGGRGCAVL